MDMAGLALPMSADTYQFPLDEVITEKVQATMDVPDNVILDSPYGPQEVEMFNIPPRTEPSPIFMGDQFFDPWDVSTQMPHSVNFNDYMEEMVEEPVEAKPQELDEHEEKVE